MLKKLICYLFRNKCERCPFHVEHDEHEDLDGDLPDFLKEQAD